jgi:hypothetical protein
MSEKRVTVYILRPKDRPFLQLQWVDPDTGGRRTKSADTKSLSDKEPSAA